MCKTRANGEFRSAIFCPETSSFGFAAAAASGAGACRRRCSNMFGYGASLTVTLACVFGALLRSLGSVWKSGPSRLEV